MDDYLIKKSTLNSLADEIRELSGTTATKSPDTMISDVNAANAEIDEQTALIAQLQELADSLPEAGEGDIVFPSLANPGTSDNAEYGKQFIDGEGNIVTGTIPLIRGSETKQVTPVRGYNIGPCVRMSYSPDEKVILTPEGSIIDLCAPFSDFGDVPADKVPKGYTFTSEVGFKVEGTAESRTDNDVIVDGANITIPAGHYTESVEKTIDTDPFYDEGYDVGYESGYDAGLAASGGEGNTSEIEEMLLVSDGDYDDEGYMFYSPYKHLEVQRTGLSSKPTITTILNKQSVFYLHIYMQVTIQEVVGEDEYGSHIYEYPDYNYSFIIDPDGDISLDFSDETGTVVDTNIIGVRWSTDGI